MLRHGVGPLPKRRRFSNGSRIWGGNKVLEGTQTQIFTDFCSQKTPNDPFLTLIQHSPNQHFFFFFLPQKCTKTSALHPTSGHVKSWKSLFSIKGIKTIWRHFGVVLGFYFSILRRFRAGNDTPKVLAGRGHLPKPLIIIY